MKKAIVMMAVAAVAVAMADDFQANPVPAIGQNAKDQTVFDATKKGPRVLFVGNSITLHGPRPQIGWTNSWGMAATCRDNDYVHLLQRKIAAARPDAQCCLLQVAASFERSFFLADWSCEKNFAWARAFKPDVIVLFFGANVPYEYDAGKMKPARTFGDALDAFLSYLDPDRKAHVLMSQGFYMRPKLDAEKESVARRRGDVFVNMEDIRSRKDVRGRYNHPGDLGMRLIAERFWEKMEDAVKSFGGAALDVLCIYYPEWHVYPEGEAIFGKGRTEWDYVDSAKPRFPGHEQPLRLLDGHPDDSNPADVAKEIDYAADAGIDAFVYDWYWADGKPIQHEALERGFLKAPNRKRLKFALMWANHWRSDVFRTAPGKCNDHFWWKLKYDRVEFLAAIDYCIAHYFVQPEYYRKDGRVFLSIYSARELVKGLGGPEKAKQVFAEAQAKMKHAGLPPLHLSAMVRNAGGAKAMAEAGFDSTSAYNITPYEFDDSQVKAETGETRQLFTHKEFAELHETFNAKVAAGSPVPFIPVVSRGWDPSPRCRLDEPFPWRALWYPYLGIIKDLSPDCFAQSVVFAKLQAMSDPKKPGAILINAWNEYTEGSYLMPDETNGDGYLKALRRSLGILDSDAAENAGQ